MYKSGICDTKPAISLKRSSLDSRAKLTTESHRVSIDTRVRPIDWWQIWWTLAYFSGEQLFHNGYLEFLRIFSWSATIFRRVRGLANRNLFPEFRELWSGGSVIPCADMHQYSLMHL